MRLDPKVLGLPEQLFGLAIEKMRHGWYSDKYFQRAKRILEKDDHRPRVLMQVFGKKEAVIGGIDAAIAVLRGCSGRYEQDGNIVPLTEHLDDQRGNWVNKFNELTVMALNDGDAVKPWETVMTIEGDYSLFAHLETLYLGVLGRGTRIATNVKRVVEAADRVPVLFFPARFDHPAVQTADGYAAMKSGALGVSTDAQAAWWGGEGLGTIPHGLIAAYDGDTALATKKFSEIIDPKVQVISLVDYENDCVKTSLDVARALGKRLWGVRLDTGENMVDKSASEPGVTIELVNKVRNALDKEGFQHVKIVASGGFDEEKIKEFQEAGAPVGAYGVGSSLMRGSFDFTADIVQIEKGGRMVSQSKAGRQYKDNPRLEKVF